MLEINYLRENKDAAISGLSKRNINDITQRIEYLLSKDDDRKQIQSQLDTQLAELNGLSKQIGVLIKDGNHDEANVIKEKVAAIKASSNELEGQLKSTKEIIEEILLSIPNIPYHLVPAGKDAEDNEVFQQWDKPFPTLYAGAKPHWELAEQYNLFDLKLGAKISGSGFPLFRGKGAQLQRALIGFFLDQAGKRGYEEIQPPILVNADSARGTGQLPDKEGQMYYAEKDDLYLIPTAEVPLTNIYRDVILNEKELPIKLCGYTPCFRREAGSYGAHVKGLNRVHQFDKVEIVRFEHPDKSYDALMEMVQHVSELLEALELPYRILRLCGGDMGFTSAMTFDFEVYSTAQERWLEVSSVSNFETFQSNRMKTRYKDEQGKNKLVHTLNGSALALARIVASILENHQTPEGIKVPAQLVPYTGFEWIN
jgi:seryl-tRNA synthetase